jgi:hypothetical protein
MEKKERENLRATKNREIVAKIKTERGCVDCGYNKDARALEFDHVDNSGKPYTGKQRTVASLMYHSWDRIMEEINKCEVVCCNCHAIRTHKRRS